MKWWWLLVYLGEAVVTACVVSWYFRRRHYGAGYRDGLVDGATRTLQRVAALCSRYGVPLSDFRDAIEKPHPPN